MTGFLLLGALLAAAVFGLLSLGYWRRSRKKPPPFDPTDFAGA